MSGYFAMEKMGADVRLGKAGRIVKKDFSASTVIYQLKVGE